MEKMRRRDSLTPIFTPPYHLQKLLHVSSGHSMWRGKEGPIESGSEEDSHKFGPLFSFQLLKNIIRRLTAVCSYI